MPYKCAACGSDAWPNQHSCVVAVKSPNLGRHWWNRLFSRPDTYGALITRNGVEAWRCSHHHEETANGRRCAEKLLEEIQDPSTHQDDLPRPQPTQVKESAGFHAPVPGLTNRAWAELREIFNERCRYCGTTRTLEREHRTPMSRNGQNTISNIVPACRSCNQAKGTATEDEYLDALRQLWGRRVRRKPPQMEQRLATIEQRYAREAAEDRAMTLLRSIQIPRSTWPTMQPERAVLAINYNKLERIAGISYRTEAVQATLGRHSEWRGYGALIPEPNNVHDDHAVGVWRGGRQLGYLPRGTAAEVHDDLIALLDGGTAVAVGLIVFRTDRGMGGRVKLAIPLATQAA